MPLLRENAKDTPDRVEKNAPSSQGSPSTSTSSTPITPLTNSTLSTPSSLYSTSPDASAFFRFITDNELELERTAFPREQTLLDLLIHSSGIQNTQQLRHMREIKLRVLTSTISLSRLPMYVPNLRVLNLDGSGLTSLREIGTMLIHLKILHVSKCGLNNLDGTFGLTNLTELYATDNYIDNIGPCTVLEKIKIINLDGNPLRSIGNVTLLSLCPNLIRLSMKRTPISRLTNYKKIIKEFIPNLKRLDGDSTNGEDSIEDSIEIEIIEDSFKSIEGKSNKSDETTSCSIEVSSLTEASCEDDENQKSSSSENNKNQKNISDQTHIFVGNKVRNIDNSVGYQRPATALGVTSYISDVQNIRRPRTALSNNCKTDSNCQIFTTDIICENSPSPLTSGGVVCGNITRALSRARPPQKPIKPSTSKPIDPWIIGPPQNDKKEQFHENTIVSYNDSDKSPNIMSKDHLEIIEEVKKIIEEPLPTKPTESTPVIDLELGITGSASSEYLAETENNIWERRSDNALEISKRWRKAFRLFRKKHRIELTKTTVMD